MKTALPAKRLFATLIDFALPFFLFFTISLFSSEGSEAVAAILALIFVIVLPIYQLYLFSQGQTIGKKLLKMRVVKKDNQEHLGFFGMLIRDTIGKWISGLVLSLGYIWILIDDENQAWHDKFMDTLVVDVD